MRRVKQENTQTTPNKHGNERSTEPKPKGSSKRSDDESHRKTTRPTEKPRHKQRRSRLLLPHKNIPTKRVTPHRPPPPPPPPPDIPRHPPTPRQENRPHQIRDFSTLATTTTSKAGLNHRKLIQDRHQENPDHCHPTGVPPSLRITTPTSHTTNKNSILKEIGLQGQKQKAHTPQRQPKWQQAKQINKPSCVPLIRPWPPGM